MKRYSKFVVRAICFLLAAVLLVGPLTLGMDVHAADTVIKTGTTTASYLFVRTGPGSNYARATGLWRGSPVDILEEKDGWYRIDTGWISSEYVKLDGETSAPVVTPAPTPSTTPSTDSSTGKTGNGTVTASMLFIRKDPSTNYSAIGMLRKGDRVQILEANGNWLRIDAGWIYGEYVAMDDGTPTYSEKWTAVVTANELNIREYPSYSARVIGTMRINQKVEVLGASGEWLRTNYGWIHRNFVKLVDDTNPNNIGTVKAMALNVRKGPGTNYAKVGTLRLGEKITILENQGDWYRINSGWVRSSYIKIGG